MKSIAESGKQVLPAPTVAVDEYAELKKSIKQAGLLDKHPHLYTWRIILTLIALFASLLTLVLIKNLWFQLGNALFLAIVFAQIGFLGHDAGHRQGFVTPWKNDLAGLLLGNLLLGMSQTWWVDKHNQHHSHPNQLDLDPDLDIPGISFNPHIASQKRGFARWIMLHQIWLFFPLLTLVSLGLNRSSVKFLLKGRKYSRYWVVEVMLLLAHWVWLPLLLVASLGFWQALLFFAINQGFLGFILGSAFAPNHKGMPVLEKESRLGFLHRQVITSRNIHAGILTDFWYGGLNYQIEHHLFPTMPRHHLRAAQSLVKRFCRERHIPYIETSILGSYRAILQALDEISSAQHQQQASLGK
ncbi:MAG: acyl-CoA desaturase [Ktedonobacteraceae bacterium]|nr:acyl-CoA desaturase [Ktedonobacteraceae bacterium]